MKKIIISIIAGVILSLTPAFVKEQEKQPEPYYTGIMTFLKNKSELVIVAPTLDEDLKEAGMLSCERKKVFLEKYFDRTVRIKEDSKLTEKDKFLDLIIIGKDNALLKEIWRWTPIRVTPDNFFFFGEEFSNPRDHTIFVQVSPFDESKHILICTSIDPDIDKIRPIPLIGSDWVVMRNFSILKQGRFYPGTSLPPSADPHSSHDYQNDILKFYNNLVRTDSLFFQVFYSSDSSMKHKIKDGIRKREAALSTILKQHGIKPSKKKIKLFCYKDQDEKKDKAGVPDPIHFLGRQKEVHMIEDLLFVDTFHEDAHVVSELILSNDAAVHFAEGFAIYIDGKWKGEELDFMATLYQKMDKIPSFSDLLSEKGFSQLPPNLSFPLLGSITEFIIDKYGFEKFKMLLGFRKLDDNILKETMGLDLKQFQLKWEKDIKQKAARYAKKVSFYLHNYAAKEFADQKDFESAVKEMIKALEFIPDDPQTFYNLALSYIQIPKLKEAEKILLKLLSLKLPEAETPFIIFGHYQLARVYDLKGEREKALSEYHKVLSLPDTQESHDLARQGIENPASPEDFK